MGTVSEPQPSVTLALVLTLGQRSEAIPVFRRDLLVDAAVVALREMIEDAQSETHPAVAAAKAEEAIFFSRVLRRLVPEMRELLESSCAPTAREAVVQ